MKYLVAFRGWDDDWDTDNGFIGKVQFYVSLRDPAAADQSQSNGFESDNDADGSTLSPFTNPLFVNGSVFGPLDFFHNNQFLYRMHSNPSWFTTSIYNTVLQDILRIVYRWCKGDSPTQAATIFFRLNCVMSGMTANYKTDATSLSQLRHGIVQVVA
jgi:hypothetical protein